MEFTLKIECKCGNEEDITVCEYINEFEVEFMSNSIAKNSVSFHAIQGRELSHVKCLKCGKVESIG